jgi:hypothetical protein
VELTTLRLREEHNRCGFLHQAAFLNRQSEEVPAIGEGHLWKTKLSATQSPVAIGNPADKIIQSLSPYGNSGVDSRLYPSIAAIICDFCQSFWGYCHAYREWIR